MDPLAQLPVEIREYALERSARRDMYRETPNDETIQKILTVFLYARPYCYDLFPNFLSMFVHIDNVFSDEWLAMLDYCTSLYYPRPSDTTRYYRIIFYASLNGWLSGMRPSKVESGELDDEFSMILLSEEFDIGTVEEIMSIISAKDDEYYSKGRDIAPL
jgi:hypothetical protein